MDGVGIFEIYCCSQCHLMTIQQPNQSPPAHLTPVGTVKRGECLVKRSYRSVRVTSRFKTDIGVVPDPLHVIYMLQPSDVVCINPLAGDYTKELGFRTPKT